MFTGRAGTISAVPHTKAAMTLAKAPDEASKPFPIVEWTESRYYFNGKRRRGCHHSAISHIYSEATQAKAGNISIIKDGASRFRFYLLYFKT